MATYGQKQSGGSGAQAPVAPAPERQLSPEAGRFLQRLPQFVQFFFPLTLITGFREFSDVFGLTTTPSFDFGSSADVLVAASFMTVVFWVVTDWIAYSWLIEHHPYTLSFPRFYVDVARFSLMFAAVNFSFLASQVESYQLFMLTLAVWHVVMIGWHTVQLPRVQTEGERRERLSDAAGHGLRFLTYLVLGVAYYVAVASRAGEAYSETVRYAIVASTLFAIIAWNSKRLSELKGRALRGV